MSNRDDFNSSTRAPSGSTGSGNRTQSGASRGGAGGNYNYSAAGPAGNGTQQIRDQAGNVRTVVVGNYNTGGKKVGTGNSTGVYNGNGQRIGGAMMSAKEAYDAWKNARDNGLTPDWGGGYSSYPGTAGPINRQIQQVNIPNVSPVVAALSKPIPWVPQPPMGHYYNQYEAGRIPGVTPTAPAGGSWSDAYSARNWGAMGAGSQGTTNWNSNGPQYRGGSQGGGFSGGGMGVGAGRRGGGTGW